MFRIKHPDIKVTYHYYLKFFRENFILHFGRPQVDTCNKCEEFTLKIKSSTLGDAAKKTAISEKIVHERRAKKCILYVVQRKSVSSVMTWLRGVRFHAEPAAACYPCTRFILSDTVNSVGILY